VYILMLVNVLCLLIALQMSFKLPNKYQIQKNKLGEIDEYFGKLEGGLERQKSDYAIAHETRGRWKRRADGEADPGIIVRDVRKYALHHLYSF